MSATVSGEKPHVAVEVAAFRLGHCEFKGVFLAASGLTLTNYLAVFVVLIFSGATSCKINYGFPACIL